MNIRADIIEGAVESAASVVAAKPALALGERIGSIFTPDRVEYFSERLYQRAMGWPSLQREEQSLLSAGADLEAARLTAQGSLERAGLFEFLNDPARSLEIAQLVRETGQPDAIRDFERFSERFESYSAVFQHLSAKLDTRVADLAAVVDRELVPLGMPAVEVHTEIGHHLQGAYSDGGFGVRRSFLLSGLDPMVYKISAHELTHAEQHYLVTARTADLLGIRETPTVFQSVELQARMSDFAMPLSAKTMESFLRSRAGRALKDETAERADALAQAQKTLRTHADEQYELIQRVEKISGVVQAATAMSRSDFSRGFLPSYFTKRKARH